MCRLRVVRKLGLLAIVLLATWSGAWAEKIYVTDTRGEARLVRANLDGTNPEALIIGNNPHVGYRDVALDLVAGKIYLAGSPRCIHRTDLDGSNLEVVTCYAGGFVRAHGIAVDTVHGKVYWSNTCCSIGIGQIQRADLNGENAETFEGSGQNLRDVALDLDAGKVYWTQAGALLSGGDGQIRRANLDGSEQEAIVTGLNDPDGIALDLVQGKVYWTDPHTTKIQRANLDGSNVEDLLTGVAFARDIAVDAAHGLMYWTLYGSGEAKIQRAAMVINPEVEDLIVGGLELPQGLALDLTVPVGIEVKPGSYPNSINPRSWGVIPVALLGSGDFDVADVDVTTLVFGAAGAAPRHDLTDEWTYNDHLEDVNLDGFMDLVMHYETQETGILCGDTEATLSGQLSDGRQFQGTDEIRTVGCPPPQRAQPAQQPEAVTTTPATESSVFGRGE